MERHIRNGFVLVVLCSLLVACGGGGGGGGSTGVATGTGVFVDSPVEGLNYVSGTVTGVTDQNGTYKYEVGLTVKFNVGDILVGETTPKAILTPKDLVPGANVDDPTVLKITRFLMSLDVDDNPSNGIVIPSSVNNNCKGKSIDFATVSDGIMDSTIMQVTGKTTVVTNSEAQVHLTETLLNLFAGTYKGIYGGDENGTWDVLIDGSGSVTGSGYSTTYQFTFGVTGSVNANGSMSLLASGSAGSATFSGTVDVANGSVTGNWQYVPPPGGGTYSGARYSK